jgi:hypothetical protein
MLHYTETASISTIVSLPVVSSQSQCQEHATGYVSSAFSYAIGPIDPAQLMPMHARLSTGDECVLLVPAHLPPSLLAHPAFKDGYEWGYLEGNPEEEAWTVPKLVNELYQNLEELSGKHEPDFYPWTLGFFLGELANIAEQDWTLALTGLAHYCFLLPLLTQERPANWPRHELYNAYFLHRQVVKAYRARVRVYREQGKSFDEAQRLALS